MKFSPQVSGSRNNAEYGTVKEHIITQIQNTYEDGHDIAQSLRDMVLVDLDLEKPVRLLCKFPRSGDPDPVEQAGADVVFKAEF